MLCLIVFALLCPARACTNAYLDYEQLAMYINDLDLYVVSSGGVGGHALVDYLDARDVRVRPNAVLYHKTCHLGNERIVRAINNRTDLSTPTLVIVGDIWQSLASQHRRHALQRNIGKLRFGNAKCEWTYAKYLDDDPSDPVGIKTMLRTYHSYVNATFLRAPFTLESLKHALRLLNLDEHLVDGFKLRERTYPVERNSINELRQLYEPYEQLDAIIADDDFPDAWFWHPNALAQLLME